MAIVPHTGEILWGPLFMGIRAVSGMGYLVSLARVALQIRRHDAQRRNGKTPAKG